MYVNLSAIGVAYTVAGCDAGVTISSVQCSNLSSLDYILSLLHGFVEERTMNSVGTGDIVYENE